MWYYINKEREMTRPTRKFGYEALSDPNKPKGRSVRWVAEFEEYGIFNSAVL